MSRVVELIIIRYNAKFLTAFIVFAFEDIQNARVMHFCEK